MAKKLTPAQKEKARKADAARYKRDREKRIRAEVEYQKKEKEQHPEVFRARAKVNNAVRDGRMKKPKGQVDFHHSSYSGDKPKGKWEAQKKHRRRPNPKTPRTK